jgi:hypothetical protein
MARNNDEKTGSLGFEDKLWAAADGLVEADPLELVVDRRVAGEVGSSTPAGLGDLRGPEIMLGELRDAEDPIAVEAVR